MLGLGLGFHKQHGATGTANISSSILDTSPEEIDVIILLGQSNNDGRSGPNEVRAELSNYFDAQPTNKYIWHKPAVRGNPLTSASFNDDGALWYVDLDSNISERRTTQVIGLGSGGSLESDGTDNFSQFYYGPESELAFRHAQDFPNKKLIILKCAVGSRDIAEWDFQAKAANKIWAFFMTYIHNPAIAYLQSRNKTLNLLGVSWVHGEADANASNAPNYQAALSAAAAAFNSDLFAVPPKILIQGLSSQYNGNTNGDTIETAQKAVVAATANAVYIEADGSDTSPAYGLRNDNVHYNPAGLEQMGIDNWAALSEFSPLDMGSDLVLWQDASDSAAIIDTAGYVSELTDKSANGFNALQSTTANQPVTGTRSLNSLNGLNLDGSNDFLSMSTISLPYESIAFATVYIPDDTNDNDILFGNNGSGPSQTRLFEKNQACDFGNSALERASKTSGGGIIQVAWVEGTGNTTQHLKINDETPRSSGVSRSGISSTFRVGGYGSGGNYADHALFERIIIVNPTAEKLNQIGNYYANKYNIAWSDIP